VLVPLDYPTWLDELLRRLGATLAPIALVSVGYQLQLSLVSGRGLALTVGLLFKLVIAPALILLLFVRWLSGDGQVLNVTVFEAAMAPMIGASIVAIDHELNPPLVTLMVGLGIQLSFVTLPVWWRLLGTM
jgi:predicted permease